MTAVFHRIVRIKPSDPERPTRDVNKYLRQHPGIDYLVLANNESIEQITLEFICSNNNPSQPRTMKDIDNLLMHLEVVKELSEHRNEPTNPGGLGQSNHLLQISVDKDSERDGEIQQDSKEIERG